ncbi:MAG: hypothetical protein ABJ333_18385 [Algoriphagus sp.]
MYLIVLIELPTLLFLIVLYATSEDKQELAIALGVVLGTMALLLLFVLNLKLETRIDSESVAFRYAPFIRKWRKYPKEQIKSITVIKYSPIADYGGWGIKGNKTTKAYSVIGEDGLLMDVGEKKKIMIGTMKSKELSDFLQNWIEE